jgi:hypothetical protein
LKEKRYRSIGNVCCYETEDNEKKKTKQREKKKHNKKEIAQPAQRT